MQDLPGCRCSFTKVLWDEKPETLVTCNIHESFLQRSKYSESSFYSRDAFLTGLKIFFCQRKVPKRNLGDHARAERAPCSCSKQPGGFSLFAREPSEIGDNSTCKLYHDDLYDSTPIYSLHQFILSPFLEQQLSFQGLNKKKNRETEACRYNYY